jgi:hypothetical protein
MGNFKESNPQVIKSKPALFIQWPDGNAHCVIGVADKNVGLSVMLDPIEVEALILHLCQSPWRKNGADNNVTVH